MVGYVYAFKNFFNVHFTNVLLEQKVSDDQFECQDDQKTINCALNDPKRFFFDLPANLFTCTTSKYRYYFDRSGDLLYTNGISEVKHVLESGKQLFFVHVPGHEVMTDVYDLFAHKVPTTHKVDNTRKKKIKIKVYASPEYYFKSYNKAWLSMIMFIIILSVGLYALVYYFAKCLYLAAT